ncbi:hypothetical protein, partial [Salmonella enterica]|uniref:hypothetical protein n=1 Tax=Salmonella enterica TaxID=28901 RepID=UPI002FCD7BEE
AHLGSFAISAVTMRYQLVDGHAVSADATLSFYSMPYAHLGSFAISAVTMRYQLVDGHAVSADATLSFYS